MTDYRLPDEDLTVLVERAAEGVATREGHNWQTMPATVKNVVREQCLPFIFHGTMALHDLGYRKSRTVTSAEELDALPEGTLIFTPNTNPDYPSVFRKVGRNQWSDQDPGDRSDGEDTTTAAGLLRWESKDHTAVVLWEPEPR